MSSSEDSFVDNSTHTDSFHFEESMSARSNNRVLYVFLFIAAFSLLLNGRVVLFVLLKYRKERRHRSIWLLMAHLAVISICVPFFYLFNTGEKVYLINLGGPACKLLGYGKSVFLGAFAVNINIIVLERVRSFQDRQNKFLTWPTLVVMWIIPAVLGIPTALMSKAKSEPLEKFLGYCETVKLLGSQRATVIYELIRLLLLHVAVAVNMIWVIFKIRSKLNFLQANSTERYQGKLRSIRLIYYHFTSFAIVWLPSGVLIFMNRIIARVEDGSGKNPMEKYTTIYTYFSVASFVHFIVTPSISLLLMEKSSAHFLCCCGCSGYKRTVTERQGFDLVADKHVVLGTSKNKGPPTYEDSSRVSTFNFTTITPTIIDDPDNKVADEVSSGMGETTREFVKDSQENVQDSTSGKMSGNKLQGDTPKENQEIWV